MSDLDRSCWPSSVVPFSASLAGNRSSAGAARAMSSRATPARAAVAVLASRWRRAGHSVAIRSHVDAHAARNRLRPDVDVPHGASQLPGDNRVSRLVVGAQSARETRTIQALTQRRMGIDTDGQPLAHDALETFR